MAVKMRMLGELDEQVLLLPSLVDAALGANDRAKYRLGLLQAARLNASSPDASAPDLGEERRAAGVEGEDLDRVVSASRSVDGGCFVPGASRIVASLFEDVSEMLAPVKVADPERGAPDLERRLAGLSGKVPEIRADVLPSDWIAGIASSQRSAGDSVHLLVMDLHKAINEIQARISEESIDGARVYRVGDRERTRVAAFMRGLNRTAPLKFDHPGLGTTATQNGNQLILQNDIGTTDAHVLVIHVTDLDVTITYTDLHIQRLEFFQRLFRTVGMAWHDTRSRRAEGLANGDAFFVCVGKYSAADGPALEAFLEFLGSRLVYLIDWNRARKRLRPFVKKRDAIALLEWAADHDHGHRAFLELGGEQLIFSAMERAMKTPFRFGEQLADMLGRSEAIEYLRFVLKTTADGLLEGRSRSLIQDEVRAELMNHFQTIGERMLDRVSDHAALIFDLASTLRDDLLRLDPSGTRDALLHDAQRAKRWEKQADALVVETRELTKRAAGTGVFLRLMELADDVADGIEEAAFHLTLLENHPQRDSAVLEPLQRLGGLLVAGAQDWVRALETARHLRRGAPREDVKDFLSAVDRIITVEHETDDVEREVTQALVTDASDFRQLFLLAEVARDLEQAADALMHTSLLLRDYVLGEQMGG